MVIYESTVPRATNEICPVLEKMADLKLNDGFFVGYSPERVVQVKVESALMKLKR